MSTETVLTLAVAATILIMSVVIRLVVLSVYRLARRLAGARPAPEPVLYPRPALSRVSARAGTAVSAAGSGIARAWFATARGFTRVIVEGLVPLFAYLFATLVWLLSQGWSRGAIPFWRRAMIPSLRWAEGVLGQALHDYTAPDGAPMISPFGTEASRPPVEPVFADRRPDPRRAPELRRNRPSRRLAYSESGSLSLSPFRDRPAPEHSREVSRKRERVQRPPRRGGLTSS